MKRGARHENNSYIRRDSGRKDHNSQCAERPSAESGGEYEYILLDYPFAYDHRMLEGYIDCCIFIDTPLDVALARRVLRDMQSAPAEDILAEMRAYLQYARPAFVHMQNGHQASADYVIDGTKAVSDIADEICGIISGI